MMIDAFLLVGMAACAGFAFSQIAINRQLRTEINALRRDFLQGDVVILRALQKLKEKKTPA